LARGAHLELLTSSSSVRRVIAAQYILSGRAVHAEDIAHAQKSVLSRVEPSAELGVLPRRHSLGHGDGGQVDDVARRGLARHSARPECARTDACARQGCRPHVLLITAVGPPPWAMTIDGMDPP